MRASASVIALFVAPVVMVSPAIGQPVAPPDDLSRSLPAATASQLPRWRGFNLPYRFNAQSGAGSSHNRPYTEKPIRLIAKLGFNFVRLPLDYRFWIVDGDWSVIDEVSPVLEEVDRVVEWGGKHGVHVSINFHKAPGFCINDRTPEGAMLWTDPDAQRACMKHWAFFARRYEGIPNERVSFNLWNEPNRTDAATHAKVARMVVEAIRAEDPDRLIICDGFDFKPAPELIELGVAQAGRGYNPGQITHHRASWWHGADRWGTPTWPRPVAYGWLHAPAGQPDSAGNPLVVTGPFPAACEMRAWVGEVFRAATLVVQADGKELFRREFDTGPEGKGPWKQSVYQERWKAYQCDYDQDIGIAIPFGTKQVRFALEKGNWLQIARLTVPGPAGEKVPIDLENRWGSEPSTIRWDAQAGEWVAPLMQDRAWLWTETVRPWVDLAERGVGVMIGEFGVYHKTPHDVTLAFLEDCLKNYREAGIGWALWNFDGSFGILDSNREDVDYEEWEGHRLDRKMLELLRLY